MPGLSPVRLLSGNEAGDLPELDKLPDGKGFKDLLEGRLTESELDDIITRLESLGEQVDPALLEMLKQAAADGNDLPFAAMSLPLTTAVAVEQGETPDIDPGGSQSGREFQPASPRLPNNFSLGGKGGTPVAPSATVQAVALTTGADASTGFQADLDNAAIDLRSTGLQPTTARVLQDVAAGGAASRMPQLAPRVGEAGWHQAVAERVMLMVGRDQQSVELRLNPAHLGPMEVKLSLNHDQASVSFLANHAAVRDALEQAIPRLRDMLGQQDIQLVQADVGQRQASPEQGGRQGGTASSAPAHRGDGSPDEMPAEGVQLTEVMIKRGLVDAYV